MKPVVGPFLIAVLLAVAGGGFWMAGQTERRLADLHQQMATLRYVDGMNEDEDADATRVRRGLGVMELHGRPFAVQS